MGIQISIVNAGDGLYCGNVINLKTRKTKNKKTLSWNEQQENRRGESRPRPPAHRQSPLIAVLPERQSITR